MRERLILYEDDHLLVVNKPSGMNTHSPSPFAGEGIYDWLRHREPRWASLAIIHRLDKETSGVLLFGKTPEANRSLTDQFTRRAVRKKYLLLTDRPIPRAQFAVRSTLVRMGEKYISRPFREGASAAETQFKVIESRGSLSLLAAEPITGRTHQIRVHAADQGLPILGDTLYGGTPAPRLFLHAEELRFHHPVTKAEMRLQAEVNFFAEEFSGGGTAALTRTPAALREGLIDPELTDAYRLLHGASDGFPGWYVDRLGDFFLSQSESPLTARQREIIQKSATALTGFGVYHKILRKNPETGGSAGSPEHSTGKVAPERFLVRENGLRFELSFTEGYSIGLFLDQRDNRRRILTNHVAANFTLFPKGPAGTEVLNTFAYTCAFSICAAKAGARTTSIDLSTKYLEWGKRNFMTNSIDPAAHDFIFGDTFDWLRRLHRKQRLFDLILLDPPTFSRSKKHGTFRAESDYGELIGAALPLLRSGAVLFCSTNAAGWTPEEFLNTASVAVKSAKRRIVQQRYFPQPPDFPITRMEPAYLKTVWMRIE